MQNTIAYIQKIHHLEKETLALLVKQLEKKTLSKGSILFSPERKYNYLTFIESGIVRAYTNQEDREITFWFGQEGDVIFPYRAYLNDIISYETVELLEDCELYTISLQQLRKLFVESIAWATWGRKFAETQMVHLEEKFIDYQFKTAAERHKNLLQYHPELFKRIKLQHLASYLGMSQVSLSRIRVGIQ